MAARTHKKKDDTHEIKLNVRRNTFGTYDQSNLGAAIRQDENAARRAYEKAYQVAYDNAAQQAEIDRRNSQDQYEVAQDMRYKAYADTSPARQIRNGQRSGEIQSQLASAYRTGRALGLNTPSSLANTEILSNSRQAEKAFRQERDSLLKRYEIGAKRIQEIEELKRTGNYTSNEEDRDLIAGWLQASDEVNRRGGAQNLYRMQQEDAQNDRAYAAALRGVDESKGFLERLGGTLGNIITGTEKQWAGNMASALYGVPEENIASDKRMLEGDTEGSYKNILEELNQDALWDALTRKDTDPANNDFRYRNMATALAQSTKGQAYAMRLGIDTKTLSDELVKRLDDIAGRIEKGDKSVNKYNLSYLTGIDPSPYIEGKHQERYAGIQSLIEEGQKDLQYAKDLNLLGDFGLNDLLIDAASSTLSSAQSALLSRALLNPVISTIPGLAALPEVATRGQKIKGFFADRVKDILGMTAFGTTAYGGSIYEARQEMLKQGLDIGAEEARRIKAYGAANTAIELGTEMLFSSVGAIKNASGSSILPGFADQFGDALSSYASTAGGARALRLIGEKLGGGTEEGLEELIGDVVRDAFNVGGLIGKDEDRFNIGEYIKDYAVGFASGLMGEVTNGAYRYLGDQQAGRAILNDNDGTYQRLYDLARGMQENPDSVQQEGRPIVDAFNKINDAQNPTALQAGRLYNAYNEYMEAAGRGGESVDNVLDKATQGKKISDRDVNRILQSDTARDVLEEMTGQEITGGGLDEQRRSVRSALETLSGQEEFKPLSVEYAARRLGVGEEGRRVMTELYDQDLDAVEYVGAMTRFYNQGKNGKEINLEPLSRENAIIDPAKAQEAYNAGRMEYLESNREELGNGEEAESESGGGVRLRGGLQRNDGQSTGLEVGGMEEASGSIEAREELAGFRGGRKVTGVYQQPVSTKDLGIRNGTDNRNIRIITDTNNKSVNRARKLVESRGLNFVAFTGGAMEVKDAAGRLVQSRGFYDPSTNTIYVRADHRVFMPEQIAKHEVMHDKVRKGEVSLSGARELMRQELGEEKFTKAVSSYSALYEGTGLNADDIFEEMICDAAGNMNEFIYRGHMEDALNNLDAMRSAREAGKKAVRDGHEREGERKASLDNGIPVVNISLNDQLAKRLEGLSRADKYKALEQYLKDNFAGQTFTMSDGIHAIMDGGDAGKIKFNAGDKRAAVIGDLRNVVESAKYFAKDDDPGHPKFSAFRYYAVDVRIGDSEDGYNINVGLARNDKLWHVYDFTNLSDEKRALAQSPGAVGVSGLADRAHSTKDEARASFKNNVPNRPEEVKQIINELGDSGEYNSEAGGKFSMDRAFDSDGNELSESQQAFFAESKVRDVDGNLLVVYHGTSESFTVFDRTKGRSTMDIQGSFFSPWGIDAEGYGPSVKAYYLNIKNPAPEGVAYKALNAHKGENDAGIKAREDLERKGYDGVNNSDEEFIAFYPEQIKEVSNMTPTDNPDIRFSRDIDNFLREQYPIYKSDKENLKLAEEGIKNLIDGIDRISASGGEVFHAGRGRQAKVDIRTIGNGISADFIRKGRVNLNGVKIKNAADLAQVGQIFRNPKFETMRYIYIKNGRIVGTDSVSAKLPGISPIFSDYFQEKELIKKIGRVGADEVFILHNHPSGNVSPSNEDFNVTRFLANVVNRKTKATMAGHIIIDHDVYTELSADITTGDVVENKMNIPQASFDFLLTPSIDNDNLYRKLRNSDMVAGLGRDMNTEAGYSSIIYADTKGYVRQLQEVSDKVLINNKQFANYIRNQRREVGAGMAFVYTKNDAVYRAMRDAYKTAVLTDALFDGTYNCLSMRQNLNQDAGMYMGYTEDEIESNAIHANEEQIRLSRDLGSFDLYEANRQLASDITQLKQTLKARTEQRDKWRRETRVTKGREVRLDDSKRMAKDLIKAHESKADADTVGVKLKELAEYILNAKDFGGKFYEESRMKAYEIAHNILDEALVLNERGGENFYQDLRDYLRSNKIYVPGNLHSDLAPDGWSDFRKSLFGTMNLTAADSSAGKIDVVYKELQERFGEWLFPDINTPADQLRQMIDVVETYRPVYERMSSADMADAVEWTANDILTRVIGEEMREADPTYADRMQARLKEQKERSQAALKKVRQQRDEALKNLREHYQEVAANKRARRLDSEQRTRLLKIARRLNSLKTTRATRALLNQYIGELDLVSKSMTGKTLKNLQELQAWYLEQKENDPDFVSDPGIEKMLQRLSKKHIADMTQEEVADLTTVLLNIENEIRTSKQLIDSEEKRDIYAAGMEIIDDVRDSKAKPSVLDRFVVTETLTPEREIRKLTGYHDKDPLYLAAKELSDGQRKMMDYQRLAEERFDKWLNDNQFIKRLAGKHATEITIKGLVDGEVKDVKITPAMRISLYLSSLNDDNMRHIMKGGVKIPDMELYKKGKIGRAYEKATRVVLTPSGIREIASHMSEKERAFAEAVRLYFNTMSRDAINETSEKLKGYSIAMVDNYFRIDTDGSFLKKEFDSIKRDGSIEGMGFLKERIQGASNPVMLYDVNDVLVRSISQHAKYYGLAIPVRNFNKLFGVTAMGYETSVAETLKKNWSDSGVKYIEKMMADIQNGTALDRDVWGEALARARSRYAGAVLTTNASVAFKQTASYPTAAAVVGWWPLMKALKDSNRKVDLEKVAKYTPLLWYRMKGFSNTELGDIGKEGKSLPKVLNWIQGMDIATTKKLWLAAEYYVQGKNKDLAYGTDAFYQETARIYNRIIEETQPNYAMMQRPQILRSNSDLTRALNMFKTQPFQNFNILYDTFGNLAAKSRQYKASGTQEALGALKDARKAVARAVSSQVVSAFVFSLMQYAWDAFRGKLKKYKDDDDEMTLASWLKGMGINVLSSVGGMIPFGGNIMELGEAMVDAVAKALGGNPVFDQTFYGMSENAADSFNDMGNALLSVASKVSTLMNGGKINESTVRSLVDSGADIAQFAGIPASNLIKLFQASARGVFLMNDGEFIGGYNALRLSTDPAKYPGDYYDLLYKAYRKDPAAYEQIAGMMLRDGSGVFTEEKMKANMEKRMRKTQGVGSVKDLEQRWMNPEQQKTYDEGLSSVQGNKIWLQATDDEQKKLMDTLYNIAVGNAAGAKISEKIAGGASVGLDQTEYLLYTLALKMSDADGNGSYKQSETEDAIRMLIGLSDAERAYLFQTQHPTAKNNPWK